MPSTPTTATVNAPQVSQPTPQTTGKVDAPKSTPIITTGVVGDPDDPTAKVPVLPRLELRTFLEDKDLTNIYLLALQRMQKTDHNDPTSWFQLAAIHGRPYEAWDGVGKRPDKIDFVEGRTGGYCTHSSVLFPSWHRPYLALFEQILSKHAFDIAKSYSTQSERDRYLAAAHRFRIPYWDWATNPELPSIVAVDEEVTVYSPHGNHKIKNPLYSYDFYPGVTYRFTDGKADQKKWETWQSTVRYPTDLELNAKSRPLDMQKALESIGRVMRDKTYLLLTRARSYGAFSNDSFVQGADVISYNNIESIHNDIHGWAGDEGHMGEVDYAAFDPVFWLHHANVDRIFTIWQALYPDEYISPQPSGSGTWTTKPRGVENTKTPLTPFRAPATASNEGNATPWPNASTTSFWNSDGVRHTHTFNYTYPELKRWGKVDSTDKIRTNLRTEVIRLYGSPVVNRLLDAYYENGRDVSALPEPEALHPSHTPRGPGEPKFSIQISEFPADHWHNTEDKGDDKLHYHEWFANIVAKKYEVNGSFKVHVFLGKPDSDPAKWSSDPNRVGTQVFFATNVETTGCERCIEGGARGQRVTGTIPLTSFLGDRFQEKNLQLEPKQVTAYLKENFTWRVQKLDNTLVNVKSLRISIAQAIIEIPEPGAIDHFGILKEAKTETTTIPDHE